MSVSLSDLLMVCLSVLYVLWWSILYYVYWSVSLSCVTMIYLCLNDSSCLCLILCLMVVSSRQPSPILYQTPLYSPRWDTFHYTKPIVIDLGWTRCMCHYYFVTPLSIVIMLARSLVEFCSHWVIRFPSAVEALAVERASYERYISTWSTLIIRYMREA